MVDFANVSLSRRKWSRPFIFCQKLMKTSKSLNLNTARIERLSSSRIVCASNWFMWCIIMGNFKRWECRRENVSELTVAQIAYTLPERIPFLSSGFPCTLCPPGSFNNATRAQTCECCEDGYSSTYMKTSCRPCPANEWAKHGSFPNCSMCQTCFNSEDCECDSLFVSSPGCFDISWLITRCHGLKAVYRGAKVMHDSVQTTVCRSILR